MAISDPIAPMPIRTGAPKAKMNVYFAMLIVSLIALLFGCLFMYLEIRRFGGFGVIKGNISAVEREGRGFQLARSAMILVRSPMLPNAMDA